MISAFERQRCRGWNYPWTAKGEKIRVLMSPNKTIFLLYISWTDAFIFYVLILVCTNMILSCFSLMLAGDLCQHLPLGVKLWLLCRR